MPKSRKYKEHRTFGKLPRASIPLSLLNKLDEHFQSYSINSSGIKRYVWHQRSQKLISHASLSLEIFQKRRQNILKIRQKSLKTPHLGLKNLKKR